MAEGGNAGWSLYSNSQQNLPPKVPSTNVQYPLSLTNAINDHQHGLSDWPRLSQQSTKHQRTSSSIGFLQDTQTPWLDEIVDLPPSKRGGMHRRSASDSLAFGDPQTDVSASIECRDFDKLNEEQFLSMFADIEPFYKNQNLLDFDVMMNVGLLDSQTTPESTSDDLSTPSDYNSIYDTLVDEKPAFASEWGHLKGEHEIPQQNQQEEKQLEQKPSDVNPAGVPDPNLDPKRLKRILANRQSAQRSRVRKLQYA